MAFSAEDIVPDSPTNNFCTLNPLNTASSVTLNNGNLYISIAANAVGSIGTIAVTSGKWYWEFTAGAAASNSYYVSVCDTNFWSPVSRTQGDMFNSPDVFTYYGNNGQKVNNGAGTAYGSSFTDGDVIGVALDMDAGTVTFYKNNVSQGQAFSGLTGKSVAPFIGNGASGQSIVGLLNFGQDPTFGETKTSGSADAPDANGIGAFYYQPPTGALALCTANLPDFTPTVIDDVPQDYFKTVLYTGQTTGEVLNWDSNTNTGTVNVGFQPDLVWAKRRDTSSAHALVDSVRGARQTISSNAGIGNYSEESGKTLLSFDSDGFTVGTDGNYTAFTASGSSIVAWCWKAGGAPSGSTSTTGSAKRINTSGTQDDTSCSALATAATNAGASNVITPTLMSINQAAGFSIFKVTKSAAQFSYDTYPHGLSKAPDFIISKSLNASDLWYCYHSSINPNTGYSARIQLNQPNQATLNSSVWGTPTNITDNIVAWDGPQSVENIFYCWHSVEGYSKFGSYTGNGSPDGPFVYCGFRPAFVMVKWTSGGGLTTGSWRIMDTARNLYNPATLDLIANEAVSETTYGSDDLDILSNGFKWRSTGSFHNTSGANYIFMAYSEQPFKYSNAR